MAHYVLARFANKSNIPNALWYAMDEVDMACIPLEQDVSFGDKVFVIKKGTMYMFGQDKQWHVVVDESGGGAEVVPLTITENGIYEAAEGEAYSPVTVNVPQTEVEALEVTENGTYTAEDGVAYSPVTVNVPTGGGASENDVNFIDYDGTIVNSYSASDFAKLTAMPENPSHTGLTAQGWNWSLADAQSYVAKYGTLTIGQMYITDDGKTRVYIHLEEGRLSPYCGLGLNGTATINWGDGSAEDTMTGTNVNTLVSAKHDYAQAGDYMITIDVDGEAVPTGYNDKCGVVFSKDVGNNSEVYSTSIQKVLLGSSISEIARYAFAKCRTLDVVTIPKAVISIGTGAFLYSACRGITLPDMMTTLTPAFQSSFELRWMSIPRSITNISSEACLRLYSLKRVEVPDSVPMIPAKTFRECYRLETAVIPESIQGTMGGDAFYNCYSLKAVGLGRCTSLGGYVLSNCFSLPGIVIPYSVTQFGNADFSYDNSLGFVRFEPHNPPVILNSNAFSNLPTDCTIYVPTGSLEAYTAATNYPSSATYTYVEY